MDESSQGHSSRSRSVASPEEILSRDAAVGKEGWLLVKTKHKWERRYFVLKTGNNILYYYKSQKDRESTKGKIIQLFLAQCSQVNLKDHKYTFQIQGRSEKILLKAESIEEMSDWIVMLQGASNNLLQASLNQDPTSSNTTQPDSTKPENELTSSVHPSGRTDGRTMSVFNPNFSLDQLHSSSATNLLNVGKEPLQDSLDLAAIKQQQKDKKQFHMTVEELLKRNHECADCGTIISQKDDNAFVSLSLGMFLCRECATLHHNILGSQASDVRALDPATSSNFPHFDPKKDPMSMTYLAFSGNKKGNEFWECKLKQSGKEKPLPTSNKEERTEWIKSKYVRKDYRGPREGYLQMKRDKKKWKRVWVSLESQCINIYTDKTNMKVEAAIPLQSCAVKVGDNPNKPETFKVISPTEQISLQAVTFPAAIVWANAIKVTAATLVNQLAQDVAAAEPTPVPEAPPAMPQLPKQSHYRASVHPVAFKRSVGQQTNAWNKAIEKLEEMEESIAGQVEKIIEMEEEMESEKKMVDQMRLKHLEQVERFFRIPTSHSHASAISALVLDSQSRVTGGTVRALIERLVAPPPDQIFNTDFFYTFRNFTTPSMLIRELAIIFKKSQEGERKDDNVPQKIVSVVEDLVYNHFTDLLSDVDSLRYLFLFTIDPLEKSGMTEASHRLKRIVRNKMSLLSRFRETPDEEMQQAMNAPIPAPSLSKPAGPIPLSVTRSPSLDLYSIPELDLARQWCLLDHQLFSLLSPTELQKSCWVWCKREPGSGLPTNLNKIQKRSMRLRRWIVTSIVTHLSPSKRVRTLERFIQIAHFCKDLRNFQACATILRAVDDPLLLRFEGTWNISPRYVAMLLNIRRLLSKDKNYQELMNAQYSRFSPAVPYIDAILQNVEAIEESVPQFLNEESQTLNFERYRRISNLVQEIIRYQRLDYAIDPIHSIQTYLLRVEGHREDELLLLANMNIFDVEEEEEKGYLPPFPAPIPAQMSQPDVLATSTTPVSVSPSDNTSSSTPSVVKPVVPLVSASSASSLPPGPAPVPEVEEFTESASVDTVPPAEQPSEDSEPIPDVSSAPLPPPLNPVEAEESPKKEEEKQDELNFELEGEELVELP